MSCDPDWRIEMRRPIPSMLACLLFAVPFSALAGEVIDSEISPSDPPATMLRKVYAYLESKERSFQNKTYSLGTENSLRPGWLIQSAPNDTTSQLLDAIRNNFQTLVQSEPGSPHYVDILQLGNNRTDDSFQLAMIQSIIDIAQAAKQKVIIRYLEGNSPGPIEFKFLDELKSRYSGKVPTHVQFFAASLNYPWFVDIGELTPGSWNHAKIFAIDGKVAIVGGQNYWDDYMPGHSPPHDVSIQVHGIATKAAHQYSDFLWDYVAHPKDTKTQHRSLTLGDPTLGTALPPSFDPVLFPSRPQPGILPILTVGNLGLWEDFESRNLAEELLYSLAFEQVSPKNTYPEIERAQNPQLWFPFSRFDYEESQAMQASTTARHLLLQAVEPNGHLRISQQKIANTDVVDQSRLVIWPGEFLDDVAAALYPKGAKVDIIVSYHDTNSSSPIGGYSDDMGALALRGVIIHRLAAVVGEQRATAIAQAQLTIKQTPRLPSGQRTWNHGKVWIVDDKVFYVGSDNIYPGYLQEYGYVIGSKTKTTDFIGRYWDPLWALAVEP